MTTGYDVQMYNDIQGIRRALERRPLTMLSQALADAQRVGSRVRIATAGQTSHIGMVHGTVEQLTDSEVKIRQEHPSSSLPDDYVYVPLSAIARLHVPIEEER